MRRAVLVAGAWVVSAVVAGAAGWAGAAATTRPPAVAHASPAVATYTVTEATVDDTQSLIAQGRWRTTALATAQGQGTITEVMVTPGATIEPGTVLYSVDLRPVVAAEGTVPMFRDLQAGAEGADVRQLQRFLTARGYRVGATGTFDAATTRAVMRWQRALDVDPTGVVARGDLVFVPDLPARVTPAATLTVGAAISPGQDVLDLVAATPDVDIPVTQDQLATISLDDPVVVTAGNFTWQGRIDRTETDANGTSHLILTAADGGPLCGQDCVAGIPLGADAVSLPAEIVKVAATTGPAVPLAALMSTPDGGTYVVDPAGTHRAVKVLASADGRAVVSGIDAGAKVRLFGDGTHTKANPAGTNP